MTQFCERISAWIFLLGIVVIGCSPDTVSQGYVSSPACEPTSQASPQSDASEPPIVFSACPSSDTVEIGDPVEVVVGIANVHHSPIRIRARLDLEAGLLVEVRQPNGDIASYLPGVVAWEPVDIGDQEDYLLARSSGLSRLIDLRCDVGDYQRLDDATDCISLFDFSEPGEYLVSVAYDGWVCWEVPCVPESRWAGQVEAPPFIVRVVP